LIMGIITQACIASQNHIAFALYICTTILSIGLHLKRFRLSMFIFWVKLFNYSLERTN